MSALPPLTPLPNDRLPLPPGLALRRLPALASVVLAVLLLHAWLLAGLPLGLGGRGAEPARSVQVRQIVRLAAPAEPERAAVAEPSPPAPAPRRAPRPEAPPPVQSAAQVPDEPVAAAMAEPAASAPPPPPVLAAAEAERSATAASPEPGNTPATAPTEPAAPSAGSADGGERMPTYATRLPAPTTLRYELRRGLLAGTGELQWRPGPQGYSLTIEGSALGLPVLTWSSHGQLDAHGLAPERFVDQRRGRAGRSANFQRDRGVVSWSATPAEVPLLPGAQDRLSFMVQLAAIVDAQPERFVTGERIVMQVVGARGDVDAWAFVVQGREAVDVVGQRIEGALALRRVPRKAFDTEVDVWLDPSREHLPVRLRLATAGGGDSMEFLLVK